MTSIARHRTTIVVGLVALVAVVATAWLGRSQRTYGADLDPSNPDGNGAQALARVLVHQGVDVSVVRSASVLDRSVTDASTTILVTSSGDLGTSTTRRLLAHRGLADLVVVDPDPVLVRRLGSTAFGVSRASPAPLAAGCPAYDGLSLVVPQVTAYPASGCFHGGQGTVLAEPAAGLAFFGAPAALSDDQILDGDNAAVALRLLGQRSHLVWYVPDLADLSGADAVSASSLLPAWLDPAIWVVAATVLALALWRGRRLGRLAQEPLPVTVKAIETTRNLGRLYRSSGDRAHAAAALRTAARTRLAERLALPRRAEAGLVVRAVSQRSGRPESEVAALLDPDVAPPLSDHDLTTLAHDLTTLDREVSRP